MPLIKQYCLTHSSGEDIYLFTLRNAKGTEVIISNYGAIITSFKIKNQDGTMNDIVLGFDRVQDYWSVDYLKQYPWFGCAVGRYANRIKNAEFSISGTKYSLTKNNGNEILHGGPGGFDRKVWTLVSSGDSPQPFLELGYRSTDGEEGFPGNLDVLIQFELNNDNELNYQYTAYCDEPTAVNLTHHSYFNLNNGAGIINDYEIKLYSSSMLEQDDNLTATGNIIPVANTAFDFRNFQRIGDGLSKIPEYDKSFIVDKAGDATGLLLVAEARSPKTGIHLQVWSDEPIIHFYSGKWTPVVKGKNGIMYGPFSGFCVETHKHPNAVNIPHFPNTILKPGEIYVQKTVYKVFASSGK
jgi:aldose 1-epimerase